MRRRRRGPRIGRWILLFGALAALGWGAITCSSHQPPAATPASAPAETVTEDAPPAPTPLPAELMGIRTHWPAGGEPPVGVFTEEEAAFIEDLPASGMTPDEDALPGLSSSPTPAP